MSTIFFGSIGAIAETSDIQRRAYNQAMAEAGLRWQWTPETYRSLLKSSGGMDRLRTLADATGTDLQESQVEAIHARKTELATAEVIETGTPLRPGVADLITHALAEGIALGLVTTTYRPNIDAIATAAGDSLQLERFAVVVTRDDVKQGKPAPDAYSYALEQTRSKPDSAIAIEDTANSALAAIGAGIRTIVTPGAFTDDQIVVGAEMVIPRLGDGAGNLDSRVLAAVS